VFDPQVVALIALNMIQKVPPNEDYWLNIDLLLVLCGSQYWIGPLLARLREMPDSYSRFCDYFICDPFGRQRYFILGLKMDGSKDVFTAL
jgi:hypothetical protein